MSPKLLKEADFLFRNQKTQILYVRKTFRKERIPDLFQTTGETRIGKAKSIRDRLIDEHLKQYIHGHGSSKARDGVVIDQVIDELLRFELPRKRESTQDAYRIYLGELKREWSGWVLNRITNETFYEWLREFKRRKDRETFMDYQKYMNKILNYAYQKRYTTHLSKITNPDAGREATWKVYTRGEIKALWENMGEDLRDQFILSYECMMRLREMLRLEWSRVDLSTGTITLRAIDVKTGSKTGKGRTFIVSPSALQRLRDRHAKTTSPYVFPSPGNPKRPANQNKTAWQEAKRLARITGKARWHDLRHTAITMALLESRVEPILVSQYAGVSIRTIERVYLHGDSSKTLSVSRAVSI